MIRAVLDTNVWISASLSPDGVSGQIFRAWQEGRFEVVVSEDILEEMDQVFRKQKILKRIVWTPEEVTNFLLSLCEGRIVTPGHIKLRVVKDDPTDDKFFVAAVEGQADYIVSGDIHIQKATQHQGIRVLSPAEFLKRLKRKKRPTG